MASPSSNRKITPLALLGGKPVRGQWLPYSRQQITAEDIQEVIGVLKSDWLTQGPKVQEFERTFASYCNVRHAIAFSSGTAALHAACIAAGLGPEDEAITTPLTFVATANAVMYCGAKPVFADIQPETLNIDPSQIEKKISSRTKAILPVDFAGNPADLDLINQIARKKNLVVIEDACHALGAEYKGKRVGSFSSMTVFSFHPVKHITTGEGGMVTTNATHFAETLRRLRHHGISQPDAKKPWRYEIDSLGYNYRLSDIHSALGLRQLARHEIPLKKREQIACRYQEAFSRLTNMTLPTTKSGNRHAWHLFPILLNLQSLSCDRDQIIAALRAENIGASLHYPLVHLHPLYRKQFGFREGCCPTAESLQPSLLTLPLFPNMTEQDVQDVIDAVYKVLDYYAV